MGSGSSIKGRCKVTLCAVELDFVLGPEGDFVGLENEGMK